MATLFLAIQSILSPTIWRVAVFSISKEKQTAADTLWKGRFCRRMAGSSTHNERLAPEIQKLLKLRSMWMRQDSWDSGWKLLWLLLSWSRRRWLYRVCPSSYFSPVFLHTLFLISKTQWSMPHGRRPWDQNREHIIRWSAAAGLSKPNPILAMSSGKHWENASRNCTTLPK